MHAYLQGVRVTMSASASIPASAASAASYRRAGGRNTGTPLLPPVRGSVAAAVDALPWVVRQMHELEAILKMSKARASSGGGGGGSGGGGGGSGNVQGHDSGGWKRETRRGDGDGDSVASPQVATPRAMYSSNGAGDGRGEVLDNGPRTPAYAAGGPRSSARGGGTGGGAAACWLEDSSSQRHSLDPPASPRGATVASWSSDSDWEPSRRRVTTPRECTDGRARRVAAHPRAAPAAS
eukprot:358938-Chlamydomonas_euryale.AAC.1